MRNLKLARLGFFLLALALLTACGTKGPLTLPPNEPAPAPAPAQ